MSDEFSAAQMRNIVQTKVNSLEATLITDEWKELQQLIKAEANKGGSSISFGSRRLWKVNIDKLTAKGFKVYPNHDHGDHVAW